LKKQLLFAFVLLLSVMGGSSSLYAQKAILNLQGYNEQPYHFGFILGMNIMNFSVKPVDNLANINWNRNQVPDLPEADSMHINTITASSAPGFSVGILGSLRLVKHLDLRFIPTLSFGSRTLHYGILANGLNGTPAGSDTAFMVNKKVNSTYITLPLLFKYRSWRKDNYGAYFIGGINYSIDLAAAKKAKQETDNGTGIIKLHTHDIGAEIGAGFDFYNAYFKLSVEAKMIYGLKNMMVDDNTLYSESIKTLHSKVFMLSFTFE
jgi:hypothetical protein